MLRGRLFEAFHYTASGWFHNSLLAVNLAHVTSAVEINVMTSMKQMQELEFKEILRT